MQKKARRGYATAYRIALVDDDQVLLDRICHLTAMESEKHGWDFSLHRFSGPEEMDSLYYDAFLLDISMPYLDGIALALRIRDSGSACPILFVSSVESRVFEALRAQPVRKTHLAEELPEALRAMVEKIQEIMSNTLTVTCDRNTIVIPVHKLLYIESINKIQHIVTAERTYKVYSSMDYFSGELIKKGFYRPHRSYLVNLDAITRVEKHDAIISNGDRIPITRTQVEEIKKQLEKRFFS